MKLLVVEEHIRKRRNEEKNKYTLKINSHKHTSMAVEYLTEKEICMKCMKVSKEIVGLY